jgi:hypothetical protein
VVLFPHSFPETFRLGVRVQRAAEYTFDWTAGEWIVKGPFLLIINLLIVGPILLALAAGRGAQYLRKKHRKTTSHKQHEAPPTSPTKPAPKTRPTAKPRKSRQSRAKAREDLATLEKLRSAAVEGRLAGSQRHLAALAGRSPAAVNRALRHAQDAKLARVRITGGRGGSTEVDFLN